MKQSNTTNNRKLILASGILVAIYVSLQFSIYLYKPQTMVNASVKSEQIQLPNEATLFNAAMTYMVSIVGIPKK